MAHETNAADVANKALDLAANFAHQLSELAQQQAPVAWNLAKATAQVSAANEVIQGVVGMICLLGGFYGTYRFIRFLCKTDWDDDATFLAGTFGTIGILSLTMILAFAVFGAYEAFDVWAWVGIAHPDLYIAHKLLKI